MVVKLATCLQGQTPHLAVVVDVCLTANRVTGTFSGTLQLKFRYAIPRPRYCACARSVHIKAFADHLFALLPKRLGALQIEGVRSHTATHARHGNHLGDVAVFAIAAANRLSISKDRK